MSQMNYADARGYLAAKVEQMQAAQDQGDHAGIMRVVDSIEADGHPDWAATIRDNLADQRQRGAWSGDTRTDDDSDGW